ncbi:MAG: hypothetical protein FH748_12675 [Balneolaceae bacterium]|nr:hypothetical protein [Balneolaceae bacterium]
MPQADKSITLSPSWKAFFWGYTLGILLTPLLVGIFILWRTITKHRSYSYIITDRDITVINASFTHKIDLANIRQTKIQNQSFGVGTLVLKTQARKIEMPGIDSPEQLQQAIDKAIVAELKRLEAEKKLQPQQPSYDAGSMDRLDYLTGLWQQGLLSDEDYRDEKEHFE